MTEKPLSDGKQAFGRLETASLVLLVVAIPFLAVKPARDDALLLIVLATSSALLALLYGLAFSRNDLQRRAAVLAFCLLVLSLAAALVLQGRDLHEVLPPFLGEILGR